MYKKMYVLIALVAMASLLLSGCGVARRGIAERDELVRLFQNSQRAASNFQLVVDTQYGKLQAVTAQAQSYYDTVVRSGEVWTGNFEDESATMVELLRNYRDENGNPIDPSQLNLEQLNQNGALPTGLGAGFALLVNAIHQAPPPVPDSAVTLAVFDVTEEGMNTIQLAGTDWNDTVFEYNAKRASVSGEVVAAASEIVGFPIPDKLPFYQGGNTGPIGNPIASPTP